MRSKRLHMLCCYALCRRILIDTQMRGIGVPSSTLIEGRFAIRICITNHRSTDADLAGILAFVRTRGVELTSELALLQAAASEN
jgi:aromatic-L-amino-acid/L-tryptophan decarboxylase